MKRIRTPYLYLRLLLLAVLISCISPGPDAQSSRLAALAAKLASTNGELRVVIQKSRYVLTLYKGMTPVKSYWAVFGKGYAGGDKQIMGDKRTPEGEFYICTINHSKRFYKFMGISYPGIKHAAYGLQQGIITPSEYTEIKKANEERRQPPWETGIGGAVGIHGRIIDTAIKRVPDLLNWTDGCIALDNKDVDEIFSVVSLGTPVTIVP